MREEITKAPHVKVSQKTFRSLLEDAREVYNYTEEESPYPTGEGTRCLFYRGVIFIEVVDLKESE